MRNRPIAAWVVGIWALNCVVLWPARGNAQDPGADEKPFVRIYTASEAPRLAETGALLPEAGRYVLKTWDQGNRKWVATKDDSGIQLKLEAVEGNAKPGWQQVLDFEATGDEPLKIRVEGLPVGAIKLEGRYLEGVVRVDREKPAVEVPPLLAIARAGAEVTLDQLLGLVRGRLDRVAPPEDPRRNTLRTNHEGADFEAPASIEVWQERKREVRQQLRVTLGLEPALPRTALNAEVFGKIEREGYTIERVVLETLPGFFLAGNVYRPAKAEGPCPAILSPHGHYKVGRMDPDVQQRCIRWAKLGAVVFMYDMVGYNDSEAFGHSFTSGRLSQWGLGLATLQTWNSLRALDWLSTLADVDATRIACTGESGGGTQTFLLTALDDRIRLAAPVVMVSNTFQGGCECENTPGLRWGTDNVEFAALAAPRPMILVGATGDWTARTESHIAPALRRVYDLFGMPGHLEAVVFDFEHNYNQTSRNAVYEFLGPKLVGVADPALLREGEQQVEEAEDLLAFGTDHPASSSTKTSEGLEEVLIAARREAIESLGTPENEVSWEGGRQVLARIQRVRMGIERPSAFELFRYTTRKETRGDVEVIHEELLEKTRGSRIPLVRLVPAEADGKVAVVFSPLGKAGLTDERGEMSGLVRGLLKRGVEVVGFDALLIGESCDPTDFQVSTPATAHKETYNRELPLERLQDLSTVLAFLESRPETTVVHLVGHSSWGALALLGLPSLEGVGRAAIDLGDQRTDEDPLAGELDFPGVLQFGGLKGAAALAAPRPLWISNAGAGFPTQWPARAYELSGSRPLLRIDGGQADDEALAKWIDSGQW